MRNKIGVDLVSQSSFHNNKQNNEIIKNDIVYSLFDQKCSFFVTILFETSHALQNDKTKLHS